jgi:hypothetical protein
LRTPRVGSSSRCTLLTNLVKARLRELESHRTDCAFTAPLCRVSDIGRADAAVNGVNRQPGAVNFAPAALTWCRGLPISAA